MNVFVDIMVIAYASAMSIFFYAVLFPFFSIPNVFFTERIYRKLNKSKRQRSWRYVVVAFPVVGAIFYSTVDYFENAQLFYLWLMILGCISLAPALAYWLYFRSVKTA